MLRIFECLYIFGGSLVVLLQFFFFFAYGRGYSCKNVTPMLSETKV